MCWPALCLGTLCLSIPAYAFRLTRLPPPCTRRYSYGILLFALTTSEEPYRELKLVNAFQLMAMVVDGYRPLSALTKKHYDIISRGEGGGGVRDGAYDSGSFGSGGTRMSSAEFDDDDRAARTQVRLSDGAATTRREKDGDGQPLDIRGQ